MNQRIFSRVPVGHRAALTCDGQRHEARLANAGLGGFYLVDMPPIEPGKSCHLEVFIACEPPQLLLSADGVTCRAEEDGVALRIEKIQPPDLTHLRRLVAYNAPDADEIFEEADSEPGLQRLAGQLELILPAADSVA